MDWLEITINTASDNIEGTAAALTAAGFADLVIEDQQEFSAFLDENRAYWDYIDEALEKKLQGLSCIKLYLEAGDDETMKRLAELVKSLSLEMTVSSLPETDWEESWKENYPPQRIGQRLMVLPYWLENADTEGRLPVILDPGLTFGTGAHPSTQMVMEAMEQILTPGARCLDLGSGSGILSIAALRLGAQSAVGVDIDPKAEDIARENCGYNGFSAPEFTAFTGNVLTDRKLMDTLKTGIYDMVLVNIVADVIISLAPVLLGLLQENSTMICSGILDSRLTEVTAALTQAGLEVLDIRACEDWRCVTARRRKV